MINIKRYKADMFETWNGFVRESRNGMFLFDRNYMEYHADRFTDHSLLFFKNDELLSLLPASETEGILTSHAGLTYGGFITHPRVTASFLMESFEKLKDYLKEAHVHTFVYKTIPYIFYRLPAQEDLYVLFRNSASLFRRDISSVIDLKQKPGYTKGTKYNISKARKHLLQVKESTDYESFMKIEAELLWLKYRAKPTHSSAEIIMLANRFPNNIRLFLVYKDTSCLGGTILYITDQVVHTQYIAITDEGKEVGALDMLTDHLISIFTSTHNYFSFGISTEKAGTVLNEGLIKNKESFGARAITNDFYSIQL
ncbi:MAG: hypothetical protein JWO32_3056 [Bacteroidetes bacterium]|nr:hypothetical protein [Bacteroidota bacterium]